MKLIGKLYTSMRFSTSSLRSKTIKQDNAEPPNCQGNSNPNCILSTRAKAAIFAAESSSCNSYLILVGSAAMSPKKTWYFQLEGRKMKIFTSDAIELRKARGKPLGFIAEISRGETHTQKDTSPDKRQSLIKVSSRNIIHARFLLRIPLI